MPNIRIKDIPTTASATSSTDFIGIDGSANGTRKLNAYSPTFGGSLTVTENVSANGTGPHTFSNGRIESPHLRTTGFGLGTGVTLWRDTTPTKAGAFYLSTAGEVVLAQYNGTAWSEPFFITTTGNATLAGNLTVSGTGNSSVAGSFGIGTTSPTRPLDVRGSLGMQVNEDNAGTKVISIRSDFAGAGPAINVTTNDPLLFLTNNSECARITSGGNFGIQTTNPTAQLEIGGTNPEIRLGPAGTGSGAYMSYNTAGNYFSLNAITQGVGYRNLVFANDGGNVGIGTNAPTGGKLHIKVATGANFQEAIYLEKAGGYGVGSIQSYYTTINNYGIGLAVDSSTKMVINQAGNLLIGTTTDGGQKLQVVGGSARISYSGNNPKLDVVDGSIITKLQSLTAGDTAGWVGTESSHTFRIVTNNTTAASFDTSQNATFSGTILASSATGFILNLSDTRSQAAGNGASIGLRGTYTGSSQTNFAAVLGLKVNSTDGNYAGKMVLQTRPNGGSLTDALTLDDSQNATFAGNAVITGSLLAGKTTTNLTTVGFRVDTDGAAYASLNSSFDNTTAYNVYSTSASAYRFYVGLAGTVFATNTTISAISDARLKENVRDLSGGLSSILALKPRVFDWKEGKGANKKNVRGFIAQEIEQVFPDLVDEWKDAAPEGEAPYKSVRQDLIPVLVKAIQELTARVVALENA